ncbi:hypothetical protein DICVIV_00503 [Dictyocaulus viviparus]|uniref:Uncharacterized protein n=1 Tax=Dictyocaulus viviparus TaxID=29172 RepID=A0A0D8YBI0_DICVI|nr:hypothetical protein DICVIV_00503 [Dictyocaulus viviparus]
MNMHCVGETDHVVESDFKDTGQTEEQLESTHQSQSAKRKMMSQEKIYELVKMRDKLLKHLEKLEGREVTFDDEAKEQFYINNELKEAEIFQIRKSILDIEKLLYNGDVLTELDDELRIFHSNKCQAELLVLDTGNRILNEELQHFMIMRSNKKCVTPSFDELNSIMRDVRKQEGESSDIPDPELDPQAFLDRLENVAFLVARAHQKLISGEFLEDLDLYVPKRERPQCSKYPMTNIEFRNQPAKDEVTSVSDETFLMAIRSAGKLELNSTATLSCDEEIEILSDDSSCVDDEEDILGMACDDVEVENKSTRSEGESECGVTTSTPYHLEEQDLKNRNEMDCKDVDVIYIDD